jgi:acylphosphatase
MIAATMAPVARRIRIRGRVQGVGFRWFACNAGRSLGLHGWVRNEADGSVACAVKGPPAQVDEFVATLRRGPAHADVTDCEVEPAAAADVPDQPFTILR